MHLYKTAFPARPMFILLAMLLAHGVSLAQHQDKGLAGLEIIKTYTQEVLGTNVGFSVEIRNNNDTAFDAVEYTVTYYDGFDEQMGEKYFKWQPSSSGRSIESGKTLKDYHANWIKGANKIRVVITRVHFTDGTVVGSKKNRET